MNRKGVLGREGIVVVVVMNKRPYIAQSSCRHPSPPAPTCPSYQKEDEEEKKRRRWCW